MSHAELVPYCNRLIEGVSFFFLVVAVVVVYF